MYRDNSGNEFHSYEEACHYYGVDTPAQVAAEEAYWAEEARLVEDWAALMGEPSPWVEYVAPAWDPDLVEDCPF